MRKRKGEKGEEGDLVQGDAAHLWALVVVHAFPGLLREEGKVLAGLHTPATAWGSSVERSS